MAPRPRSGFSAGRIAGISVHVDWSVLIIFTLLVLSLGLGYLPGAHDDWPVAVHWITALFAGLLFFASVLAHELSHALVGRALGIRVERITLFIFGGLAHMEGEPKKPMAELGMTIVGPLTSIGLGIVFTWIGLVLAGPAFEQLALADPAAAMKAIGPMSSLFLWLGPVNLVLGIFNLVPAFPLDGGRVFRSIVWAITGDFEKATLWATALGRMFGWSLIALGMLMALGVTVPFFGGGIIGGLWLAMIGWFLSTAASASRQQMMEKELLGDVPVTKLMTREFTSVEADLTLDRFVEEYLMRYDQRCFPVFAGEYLAGLACVEDVRGVPREEWSRTTVSQVMKPSSESTTLTAEVNVHDALQRLREREVDQLPVVKDGALLGLVRKSDIVRWLTLHRELPAT